MKFFNYTQTDKNWCVVLRVSFSAFFLLFLIWLFVVHSKKAACLPNRNGGCKEGLPNLNGVSG